MTYGQLFGVQPFNNVIDGEDDAGQQIYDLLAQQFNNPSAGTLRMLQVVERFTYSYSFTGADPTRPTVAGVGTITPGSVKIGVEVGRSDGVVPRGDEQLPRRRR